MATSKTAAKKTAKTEVATVAEANLVPEFLRDRMQDTRGSEDVGAEDLVIPRIEVIQGLSKARNKKDDAYIEGAEEGMLYNNVTRVLYGESITVCPVFFRKEWLLWRDVDLGGGFGGAYPDMGSAQLALQTQEKPEEWEIIDTNQHFVLVVNEDGTTEEAVISMAKTKAKCSRQWNSLVRINGGPRFSRLYEIRGIAEQNKVGQEYYSLGVKNLSFVTPEIFAHAERVYELVKSGAATVDRSTDDDFNHDDSDDSEI